MIQPYKQDIINDGWRMSANINEALISRCCDEVKRAYLIPLFTEQEIADAATTSTIAHAWNALTFLRTLQDNAFSTRTGAEQKNFEQGTHVYRLDDVKKACARYVDELRETSTKNGNIKDICDIYFYTQFFN